MTRSNTWILAALLAAPGALAGTSALAQQAPSGTSEGSQAAPAAAPADPNVATAKGSIDPDALRKALESHGDQLRGCYEKQLAQNPTLQGRVVFRWTIEADGSAKDPAVQPTTTLNDKQVLDCIQAAIVTWSFPKPKDGVVVITYPWMLKPAPGAGGKAAPVK